MQLITEFLTGATESRERRGDRSWQEEMVQRLEGSCEHSGIPLIDILVRFYSYRQLQFISTEELYLHGVPNIQKSDLDELASLNRFEYCFLISLK